MTEQELRQKIAALSNEVVNHQKLELVLIYAFCLARTVGVMTAWAETPEAHQSLLDDLCAEIRDAGKESWKEFNARITTNNLLKKIKGQGAGNA